MAPSTEQKFALWHELENSMRLLKVGLRELQKIDGANDFYHLPLLTLANGCERFLKVILCLHHAEQHGDFPTGSQTFRGRTGHDLTALLGRVVAECFSPNYTGRIPVGCEDIKFLNNDQRLKRFIALLSSFGQAQRYYHLDVVLGASPITGSPEDEWNALRMELLESMPELIDGLGKPGGLDMALEYLRYEMTVLIERFVRALARLFTIGQLGALAQQCMTYVTDFLLIRDDQLGRHPY